MTDTAPASDPDPDDAPPQDDADTAGAVRGRGDGRWLAALVAVGLALLVPTIGLRLLLPHESAFCTQVGELPSVSTSLEEDGTPGPAMVRYARALDGVAAAAPDGGTSAAARLLADHEARVGAAISGASSSTRVATDVSDLDSTDPAALASARTTLDAAVHTHCG
jgi:hypothetical protein